MSRVIESTRRSPAPEGSLGELGQTDCIEDDPILGTQVLGNVAVGLLGPDFAKASAFAKASSDTPSRPNILDGAP